MPRTSGKLFVVATPIGHLEDISTRALQTLRQADLIAAEDTRNSGALLNHFGIPATLVALHEHNERQVAPGLIQKMQSGMSIALVSDAGTPAISDPGAWLVDQALAAGIPVVPIPGPSAVTALMSVSGFGAGQFMFCGFLPAKPGPRRRELEALSTSPATLVFYEAPHRIEACLTDMETILGRDRKIVIGREMTKLFETIHRCTLADSLAWVRADPHHRRGEFVLAVEGWSGAGEEDPARHDELLHILMEKLSLTDAVRLAMRLTGAGKKMLYERALALKGGRGSDLSQ